MRTANFAPKFCFPIHSATEEVNRMEIVGVYYLKIDKRLGWRALLGTISLRFGHTWARSSQHRRSLERSHTVTMARTWLLLTYNLNLDEVWGLIYWNKLNPETICPSEPSHSNGALRMILNSVIMKAKDGGLDGWLVCRFCTYWSRVAVASVDTPFPIPVCAPWLCAFRWRPTADHGRSDTWCTSRQSWSPDRAASWQSSGGRCRWCPTGGGGKRFRIQSVKSFDWVQWLMVPSKHWNYGCTCAHKCWTKLSPLRSTF